MIFPAIAAATGAALILLSLWDAFETVILPRSVVRLLRLSRTMNTILWRPWSALASRATSDGRRERYLSFYGPLSIILMIALWALALIVGFALMSYGLGSRWTGPQQVMSFTDDLYVSGTTLFTLGLGDIAPASTVTRVLLVVEAGVGLGFLTVGIAYLPVIYQSFSRRESQIARLDAWAGSPPAAVEILRRLADAGAVAEIHPFLKDWERWCADVLESQISYPQVAYFRSQHGRQSWVSALTAVLDVSAVIHAGIDGIAGWQARQTFAMARHAAVDLSQVLVAPPRTSPRMTSMPSERVVEAVTGVGYHFTHGEDAGRRLLHLRNMYEPFVAGLAHTLAMDLPPWIRDGAARDNWESTPRAARETHL
jgi:hypothetical protein